MSDIHWMSCHQLSLAYQSKELTPLEVVQHLLSRIERLDPTLNSFCLTDPERSLRDATESTRRWRTNNPKSQLDGVPIAIKDQILVKGWPTLRGSKAVDPSGPWDEDAPVVAMLREAGLVLLGKTTTSEYGWRGSTDTLLCGATRNPWNLDKTPGGSSGGSASAVAAGLVPVALGTDGGGSVRIPAAFTGLYGLKPTYGRVPTYPASYMGRLAHTGPLARTAQDLGLVMDIIAQPDQRDPDCTARNGDNFSTSNARVSGTRFQFSSRFGYIDKSNAEVDAIARGAFERLANAGGLLLAKDFTISDPTPAFGALFAAGTAHFFGAMNAAQHDCLEDGLKQLISECQNVTLSEVMSAADGRNLLCDELNGVFEQTDFLVSPTVATTAFEINKLVPSDENGEDWQMWSPFTYPFNLSGHPAITVPCGLSKDGLPVGLQIVGRKFEDQALLSIAKDMAFHGLSFEQRPATL